MWNPQIWRAKYALNQLKHLPYVRVTKRNIYFLNKLSNLNAYYEKSHDEVGTSGSWE